MNNKSDDNRGGLGKSLLERVKDISQKAGKALAGFVGSGGELEKEARRKAEIRINEIIKRLSSGNLSATEIQELIREGNELLQTFPGLSIATAFSSVASQVGGNSATISQSQPIVTNNAGGIKDEKIISLSELFDFHPDIIKAEEENKKLQNRFDAIKREPPNEESIKATREGLDDSRDDNYITNYVETQKKSLQVMKEKQQNLHKEVHEHNRIDLKENLKHVENAIKHHTEECVEHLKDIFRIRKVASQLGDKKASELDDKKILECRNNLKQVELTSNEEKRVNNIIRQSTSIGENSSLKSLLNSTALKQEVDQPSRENQNPENGKWVRKISLENDSNEKGKNGSGDNNKNRGGRGG
ncbi:hypothetical protein I862_05310 [endosymbiont of Acanthamoeba sp. UWC8]|uniref:hypothetical protein n=1 Tax=endosymbiont of Acanthamoeba sp. UWC8 TaxID=86106 RepID=UPI0004D0B866|nr:hypothetical protein [endosymbiont of Acanthamoeba sp. UWC8]AIF81616.1 hypothetical protein I862_05310 [endosymbiont of Acanthamoeba sp. UWC8]